MHEKPVMRGRITWHGPIVQPPSRLAIIECWLSESVRLHPSPLHHRHPTTLKLNEPLLKMRTPCSGLHDSLQPVASLPWKQVISGFVGSPFWKGVVQQVARARVWPGWLWKREILWLVSGHNDWHWWNVTVLVAGESVWRSWHSMGETVAK